MVTVGGGSSRASLASFCSGDFGGLDGEAVDSGLGIANAKLGRSEGSGRRGELAGLSTIGHECRGARLTRPNLPVYDAGNDVDAAKNMEAPRTLQGRGRGMRC